jgi:hypothetical protein
VYYNTQKKEKSKKVYQEPNTQLVSSDSEDKSSPARQPTSGGPSAIPAPVQMVPVPANLVFTQASPAHVIPTSVMPAPFATPLPIVTSVVTGVVILPVDAAAAPTTMSAIQVVPAQVYSAQLAPV